MTAVDLPMRTLDGDVAVLRAALDRIEEPVVLVGHSYGGAVVTAAGDHRQVVRLCFIAAFALAEGESISRVAPQAQVPDTGLGDALQFSEDGNDVSIDPAKAADLLYNRSAPAVVRGALTRLRPVGRAVFGGRPGSVAWRTRPSTYVVCTDDRTVAPQLQQIMAGRVTDQREWDCDHSPLAACPDVVADLLTELATTPG